METFQTIRKMVKILFTLSLLFCCLGGHIAEAQMTWGKSQLFANCYRYTNVLKEDLNNDGINDAICYNANVVGVYLTQLDGQLMNRPQIFDLGTSDIKIHIADIEDNGTKDIVVLVDGKNIYYIKNEGQGGFRKNPTHVYFSEQYLTNIDLADYDDDGMIDIAFLHLSNVTMGISNVVYLKNNGNGVFATTNIVTPSYTSADIPILIDMDNDGVNEIMLQSAHKLYYMKQINGEWQLSQPIALFGDSIQIGKVIFKDINNDNLLDIVWGNYHINWQIPIQVQAEIEIWFNTGDLNTWIEADPLINLDIPQSIKNIIVQDINSDGWNDIVVQYGNSSLVRYDNLGNNSFDVPVTILASNYVLSTDIEITDNNEIKLLAIISTDIQQYLINDNGATVLQIIKNRTDNFVKALRTDINNDSYPELIIAKLDAVLFYEGNAENEPYQSRQIYEEINNNIENIEVVDADQDGDIDIIFNTNYEIKWAANNGDGTFADVELLYTVLDMPTNTIGNTIYADVTHDGAIDVLYVNGLGQCGYLKNIASNSVIEYNINENTYNWYLSDVNGDGVDDLVIYKNIDGGIVYCYYGTNNGFLSTQQPFLNLDMNNFNYNNLIVKDINGDNKADVVVVYYAYEATPNNGYVKFYLSQNDNTFEELVYNSPATETHPNTVVDDLDNDGFLDVVVVIENQLSWYRNRNNLTFDKHQSILYPYVYDGNLHILPLGNDGKKDVLLTNYNGLTRYPFNGVTTFTPHDVSLSAQEASSVFAADLNNDGFQDILSASQGDHKIAWYRNNGNRTFSSEMVLATNAQEAQTVKATDMDNDGWIDVVSASQGDNTIAWYRNTTNNTFAPKTIICDTIWQARDFAIVDLDKDGWQDIVTIGTGQSAIVWHKNLGNGTFENANIIPIGMAATSIAIEANDINADGWADITIADKNNNIIKTYSRIGNQTDWLEVNNWDSTNPKDIYIAQAYPNQNNAEVFVASWTTDKIQYHTTITNLIGQVNTIFNPTAIEGADFDQDGDEDIVVASHLEDAIVWYDNYQMPVDSTWRKYYITTNALGATSVYAADLDNDGDQDILSASLLDDKIAWYENKRSDFPVGIKPSTLPNAAANTLHLYPNPTHDQVVVESPQNEGKPYTLSLYSIEGRLLWQSSSITHSLATVDMGTYPSGMYLLQWQGEQQTIAARILKH